MRLDQQDDDIGIRSTAPGRLDHRPVKPAARPKKARRIDKDDLRLALHRDATNARPRRLHLVCDNRQLRPHHAVEKRGLARIGLSDQGDETGACGHGASYRDDPGHIEDSAFRRQTRLTGLRPHDMRRHPKIASNPVQDGDI